LFLYAGRRRILSARGRGDTKGKANKETDERRPYNVAHGDLENDLSTAP
jgi:hypothetical protein